MKAFSILTLFVFIQSLLHAQSKTTTSFKGEIFYPFTDSFQSFLTKNFHYPDSLRDNYIETRIVIGLEVDNNGHAYNLKIVRGGHKAFENEALRLIRIMPFNILMKDGVKVSYPLTLPLNIELD